MPDAGAEALEIISQVATPRLAADGTCAWCRVKGGHLPECPTEVCGKFLSRAAGTSGKEDGVDPTREGSGSPAG